ncbi:DNA polymerase [uncultured archaeon]|nr:DNA polymerase [uncultured archaeon]
MEELLAEFVGVLLGDGSIGIYGCRARGRLKKHYRVKITLNSEDDKDYADYLVDLIRRVFAINPIIRKRPGERALDIFIFNRSVVRRLLRMGLKRAPKWNRASVPKKFLVHRLASHVLRGYLDTDGCITIANNNGIRYPRIEMKISPYQMQGQLVSALKSLGFEPRVYAIGRGKVRVVLPGMKNLEKWHRNIGFSNKKNSMRAESFMSRRKIAGGGLPTQTRIAGSNF